MDYIGEHLLPGKLGHLFIVISLVASLVATIAYFITTTTRSIEEAARWKKLARVAFVIESIAVLGTFVALFYIIHNHLFEYHYAWKHSSRSLEFKYLLACFWEGQEGSFMLWSFWHCVLGLLLIRSSRQWEAPVMTVVSFMQLALATMIAGIYIFDVKIGSNPFILLRDSGILDNAVGLHMNMDVTQPLKPDYLLSIKDGNDLNILLQNYWMVIHPPVLFLGFASVIVPFAFAIAGLWTKKFGDWVRPALPWALFSAAVLGVGIMMGAMWAYESLTFGGYWAWDPVENASLVPWLIMISAVHTLLIYKHSGYSLRATYLFFILSFAFILYSTFLTRSGILGDSSVHAFTDLGMNVQLFLFMYAFVWLAGIIGAKDLRGRMIAFATAVLLAVATSVFNIPWLGMVGLLAGVGFAVYQIQTQVPTIQKEEQASSREFWMFIGSLVFFLSAILIIAKTSLPVFNKLFATKIASPEDPEMAYNNVQIYVAVILAILTALTQYLRYKQTSRVIFWKKMLLPLLITIGISALVFVFGNVYYERKPEMNGAIWLAVASAIYCIVANAAYIWVGVNGKLKLSGGSIAHVGFGMVLLGILISSSKKEVISHNTSGVFIPFGKDSKENPRENLTLIKGVRTDMGKYWATYESDSVHPQKPQWFYNIHIQRKDGKEDFYLQPNAYVNYKGNEGLQGNPSSRHYWDHDVFTYITSLPDPEKQKEDTAKFQNSTLRPGDSLFYSKGFIIIDTVVTKTDVPKDVFGENGVLHELPLKVYAKTGSTYTLSPRLAFAKGSYLAVPDTVLAESLVLQLQKVNADKTVEIGFKESDSVMKYVTLKAYKFPFINMLWLGVLVTAIGILMSMVRRISLNRSGKDILRKV